MRRSFFFLAVYMAFAILLVSCAAQKKAKADLVYLKDGVLDTLPNTVVPLKEAQIQKGDILSIVVYSDNQEATVIFNQPISGGAKTGESAAQGKTSGYLVDQLGNIRFHQLGTIPVAGLTRLQLAEALTKQLQVYLQHPYVDVRFLNTRVTILGEVQRPGVFNLPDDKITILELLGMAGDITIYGRKENILVIREEGGQRHFARLNMHKAEVFQSPYFYLQQNDMVIVEPNSKKPTATEQEMMRKVTLVTALATLVSTVSIIVTLFK